MPELPEVETSRRGLLPMLHKPIVEVRLRNRQLRWPIPEELPAQLQGQQFSALNRRGKYLIASFSHSHLLLHLGMSGHFRLLPRDEPPAKHDHVDILFADGSLLRYHDPRRFGCILLCPDPAQHPLLQHLGPEPLSADFNAEYLQQKLQTKTAAIKKLIMNSQLVVGVGNIYASEALFLARIHPERPGYRLDFADCQRLVQAIQQRLQAAIDQGGTTLRDFMAADGKPGYFQQQLLVYERAGQNCRLCQHSIQQLRQDHRSSYYCPNCQS